MSWVTIGAREDGSTTACRPLASVKVSARRRSTENSLAHAGACGANARPAPRPPSKARRRIISGPLSEEAFEKAALAPRDGGRGAGGGLASRLGVAQALLLLGRVDDGARGRRVLPEDQAVDERLVAVVERLGVLVDAAADVGVDAAAGALARLLNQRLLRTGRGRRRRAAAAGDALLEAAGQRRRQRLLGLVGRSHFLRPGLARARWTQLGVGRHGERRMRDDLEFVGRHFLAAADILQHAAAAQHDGAQGDKAKGDQ